MLDDQPIPTDANTSYNVLAVLTPFPPTNPHYRGTDVRVDEIPLASQQFIGKNVYIEHAEGNYGYPKEPVGKVRDFSRGQNGEWLCNLNLDITTPQGRIAQRDLMGGILKDVSISLFHSKPTPRGELERLKPAEISLVRDGGNEGSHIISHGNNQFMGFNMRVLREMNNGGIVTHNSKSTQRLPSPPLKTIVYKMDATAMQQAAANAAAANASILTQNDISTILAERAQLAAENARLTAENAEKTKRISDLIPIEQSYNAGLASKVQKLQGLFKVAMDNTKAYAEGKQTPDEYASMTSFMTKAISDNATDDGAELCMSYWASLANDAINQKKELEVKKTDYQSLNTKLTEMQTKWDEQQKFLQNAKMDPRWNYPEVPNRFALNTNDERTRGRVDASAQSQAQSQGQGQAQETKRYKYDIAEPFEFYRKQSVESFGKVNASNVSLGTVTQPSIDATSQVSDAGFQNREFRLPPLNMHAINNASSKLAGSYTRSTDTEE